MILAGAIGGTKTHSHEIRVALNPRAPLAGAAHFALRL
jgi:hypothetical protein